MDRTICRAGLAGVCISLMLLSGCADPRGKFDDFVGRQPDAAPTSDAPSLLEIPDISGRFLLALATVVAPDQPFLFIAENTLTPNQDGTATLDTTITPLHARALTLVGDQVVITDVPVSGAGQFVAVTDNMVLPREANPLLDAEVTMSTVIMGSTIKSRDLYCGPVSGMLVDPLNLDIAGSTMAAIRVPPGAIGNALPEPVKECPPDNTLPDAGVPDASSPDALVNDATSP